MSFNNKIIIFFLAIFNLLIVNLTFNTNAQENFETWLSSYKEYALKKVFHKKQSIPHLRM